MKYGSLILEKKEYVYLKRILNISGYAEDRETQKCFQRLADELKSAHIVDYQEMPYDIVKFNSVVSVLFEDGKEQIVQLVIPTEKDILANKISILTPLGSALIGRSEGDTFLWNLEHGNQKIEIAKVKQKQTLSSINFSI